MYKDTFQTETLLHLPLKAPLFKASHYNPGLFAISKSMIYVNSDCDVFKFSLIMSVNKQQRERNRLCHVKTNIHYSLCMTRIVSGSQSGLICHCTCNNGMCLFGM